MTISMNSTDAVANLNPAGPLAQPLAEPISGDIETASLRLFASDDGKISSGYWSAEPGVSRWDFRDRGEIIHILGGSMSVLEDGSASPVAVGAGDSVVFPIGWSGVWTIRETITKFYVIYR